MGAFFCDLRSTDALLFGFISNLTNTIPLNKIIQKK